MLSNADTECTIRGIKISQKTMILLCIFCYATNRLIVNIRDQAMAPITSNVAQKILRNVLEKSFRRSLHDHVTNLDYEKIYLIQKGNSITRVGRSASTRILAVFLETMLISSFVLIVNYFIQLLGYIPLFSRAISQFVASYSDLNFFFRKLEKPLDVIDTHQSGQGKTTVFNLLYRPYTPTNGSIKINDQDISTVSLDSLRKAISIREQTPALSKSTVQKNICFGAENPEWMTYEYIYVISRSVSLESFLRGSPLQLDTEVGKGGESISGGQQQKAGILRGLLNNTTIRLFNEITASLDGHAANQIVKDLH